MKRLLVALVATLFTTQFAHADTCATWNLTGTRSIDQGNGFHLDLSLKQQGNALSGNAWYAQITKNASETFETNRDAGVVGHIEGAKVDFDLAWPGGQVGVYSGSIDAQGRLSGSTYDRAHPGKHVAWHSVETISCIPAPQKPVHRLGKIPHPAPVTQGDVLRAKTTDGNVTDREAASKANCLSGFVPRLAGRDDLVCVTMESFNIVRTENHAPEALWIKGDYGNKTCLPGYVWREAFEGDVVCVTPERRDDVSEENQVASSRRQ